MKNIKIILGSSVFGIIFLGIVTNAIWDLIKPVSRFLFEIILNLSILGIDSFKDSIYREIAMGLHEGVSLYLFLFLHTALVATILFLAGFFVALRKAIFSYENKNKKDISIFWGKFSNFRHGAYITPILLLFFLSYTLFASTILALVSVREVYVNEAITHFEQLLTIVHPYITDNQYKIYLSGFSQVQNKDDYVHLINELEKTAQEKGQIVPEFSFIF